MSPETPKPLNYMVEILNAAGTKVGQLDRTECRCRVRREINASWGVTLQYPIPKEPYLEDKSALLDVQGGQLRIKNVDDSTDYQIFIMQRRQRIRHGNIIEVVVNGSHISQVTMGREMINSTLQFVNLSLSAAIDVVLGYSTTYSGGTVTGGSGRINLMVAWESVLGALQKVLKLADVEYTVDEVNNEIDVQTLLGTTKYLEIRPDRNLRQIDRVYSDDKIFNKIYGVGGGHPPSTIAGARHIVDGISSQIITCAHNKLVPENDAWNTDYKIKFVTGTLSGSAFAITDCTTETDKDTVTVSGDISAGAAGDKFVIVTTAGVEVDYLIAGTAANETRHMNTRMFGITNLLETPALDGTYTAGLCEDWSLEGTPSKLENTNPTYTKYGSKSQIITADTGNEGISQSAVVTNGQYYNATAWVYVVSGVAMLQLSDGVSIYQSVTTGTGWKRLIISEKMESATATVGLISFASAAEFYVDAVQITNGIFVKTFSDNTDKLQLWFETYNKLITQKDPHAQYQCRFIDLYRTDPLKYPYEQITLGDYVYVTDEEIGIDRVSLRARVLDWNVFKPELTEHTISNL